MKLTLILPVAVLLFSCNQPAADKTTAADSTSPAQVAEAQSNIDPAARQFLIDLTNLSWFQAQLGQAALTKSTDESILGMSQKIVKEYTRIKDKAKIVSIPYNIDMPYFLTHDQNEEIVDMKKLDEATFTTKYLEKIKSNNEVILRRCESFDTGATKDNNFADLITFCKTTVKENTPAQP